MLIPEDLTGVPLLASLPDTSLTDIARTAADIRLSAGEYSTHEGDPPALFLVLAGDIEVTKVLDGVERAIGHRKPGTLYGEVPVVFGTQFQSNARAASPSRVIRIDLPLYYRLSAASAEFTNGLGNLARERMGGLQGLAAAGPKSRFTLFGDRWNPAALDLRRFLTRNQINFDWVTRDDPATARPWPAALPSGDTGPAVQLGDGSLLVRPDIRDLAERLGLATTPRLAEYDTIIIGGGPAGLAAAVYGASEGLRTLVVEREAPGGQAGTSSRIENYLGFPGGISGDELATRALRQATRLGAEILVTRTVASLDPANRAVVLDDGSAVRARTVILATGVSWRRLAVEGFDRLIGRGVYYRAARSEAGAMQGLDIHLIGAGNSAGQAAMFFANHARTVTLVVRGASIEASMSQYLVDQIRSKANIAAALGAEISAVHGADHLTEVDLKDRAAGTVMRLASGGVFVFIGADAETGWLPPDVARDPKGYVLTGQDVVRAGCWREARDPYLVETSVPGIFAVGDVRLSPVKRVAAAVGDGSMAIAFVHQHLDAR